MTRKSFELAMAKGDAGEAIVRQKLEGKGWVVYQPVTEGAHHFDMLGIYQKRTAVAFDVKATARMNKFPCTGVNQKHFDEYQQFSQRHAMPFWIVFVDEGMRQIYGNTIEELEKPIAVNGINYPWNFTPKFGAPLRLWALASMKVIADLDAESAEVLKSLSQRNHEYMPGEA